MKTEEVYKTIRIYEADHDKLLKEFSKDLNFAEIIHILIEIKEAANK